ncbi:hypothetical protein ACEQ8H_008380 [Pleosporales sp. CAS-2024a]
MYELSMDILLPSYYLQFFKLLYILPTFHISIALIIMDRTEELFDQEGTIKRSLIMRHSVNGRTSLYPHTALACTPTLTNTLRKEARDHVIETVKQKADCRMEPTDMEIIAKYHLVCHTRPEYKPRDNTQLVRSHDKGGGHQVNYEYDATLDWQPMHKVRINLTHVNIRMPGDRDTREQDFYKPSHHVPDIVRDWEHRFGHRRQTRSLEQLPQK